MFVGAFSVVIMRTGVLPKALGWLGALVALACVIGAAAVASDRTRSGTSTLVGFTGASRSWVLVVEHLDAAGTAARVAEIDARHHRVSGVAAGRRACSARERVGARAFGTRDRVPRRGGDGGEHRVGRARGNGGPASSTISTSIGGVSCARMTPNERMVRSCTSPVSGSTVEPSVSTHPSAMCAAPIAYERNTTSSSGSPAATRTSTRPIVPSSSVSTRAPRARGARCRTTQGHRCRATCARRVRHARATNGRRPRRRARLRRALRVRRARRRGTPTTSRGPAHATLDHSPTSSTRYAHSIVATNGSTAPTTSPAIVDRPSS